MSRDAVSVVQAAADGGRRMLEVLDGDTVVPVDYAPVVVVDLSALSARDESHASGIAASRRSRRLTRGFVMPIVRENLHDRRRATM